MLTNRRQIGIVERPKRGTGIRTSSLRRESFLRYCITAKCFQFSILSIYHFIVHINLLTSLDRGCIHQGCWGWVGNVAGTAVSRTRVAVQSRGPGNTHREVTYLSWAAPPNAYAIVLSHMLNMLNCVPYMLYCVPYIMDSVPTYQILMKSCTLLAMLWKYSTLRKEYQAFYDQFIIIIRQQQQHPTRPPATSHNQTHVRIIPQGLSHFEAFGNRAMGPQECHSDCSAIDR